jgi:hypothetical protein
MGFWRVVAFAFEAEFFRAPGRLVFGSKSDVYVVISSGVGYWGSICEIVSDPVIGSRTQKFMVDIRVYDMEHITHSNQGGDVRVMLDEWLLVYIQACSHRHDTSHASHALSLHQSLFGSRVALSRLAPGKHTCHRELGQRPLLCIVQTAFRCV